MCHIIYMGKAVRKQPEHDFIYRDGKPTGIILSIAEYEELKLLEKFEDEQDLKDAMEASKESKIKGTVSWKKLKADSGL